MQSNIPNIRSISVTEPESGKLRVFHIYDGIQLEELRMLLSVTFSENNQSTGEEMEEPKYPLGLMNDRGIFFPLSLICLNPLDLSSNNRYILINNNEEIRRLNYYSTSASSSSFLITPSHSENSLMSYLSSNKLSKEDLCLRVFVMLDRKQSEVGYMDTDIKLSNKNISPLRNFLSTNLSLLLKNDTGINFAYGTLFPCIKTLSELILKDFFSTFNYLIHSSNIQRYESDKADKQIASITYDQFSEWFHTNSTHPLRDLFIKILFQSTKNEEKYLVHSDEEKIEDEVEEEDERNPSMVKLNRTKSRIQLDLSTCYSKYNNNNNIFILRLKEFFNENPDLHKDIDIINLIIKRLVKEGNPLESISSDDLFELIYEIVSDSAINPSSAYLDEMADFINNLVFTLERIFYNSTSESSTNSISETSPTSESVPSTPSSSTITSRSLPLGLTIIFFSWLINSKINLSKIFSLILVWYKNHNLLFFLNYHINYFSILYLFYFYPRVEFSLGISSVHIAYSIYLLNHEEQRKEKEEKEREHDEEDLSLLNNSLNSSLNSQLYSTSLLSTTSTASSYPLSPPSSPSPSSLSNTLTSHPFIKFILRPFQHLHQLLNVPPHVLSNIIWDGIMLEFLDFQSDSEPQVTGDEDDIQLNSLNDLSFDGDEVTDTLSENYPTDSHEEDEDEDEEEEEEEDEDQEYFQNSEDDRDDYSRNNYQIYSEDDEEEEDDEDDDEEESQEMDDDSEEEEEDVEYEGEESLYGYGSRLESKRKLDYFNSTSSTNLSDSPTSSPSTSPSTSSSSSSYESNDNYLNQIVNRINSLKDQHPISEGVHEIRQAAKTLGFISLSPSSIIRDFNELSEYIKYQETDKKGVHFIQSLKVITVQSWAKWYGSLLQAQINEHLGDGIKSDSLILNGYSVDEIISFGNQFYTAFFREFSLEFHKKILPSFLIPPNSTSSPSTTPSQPSVSYLNMLVPYEPFVLAIIILCSETSLEDRLFYCFQILDSENEGLLDLNSLSLFFHALLLLLYLTSNEFYHLLKSIKTQFNISRKELVQSLLKFFINIKFKNETISLDDYDKKFIQYSLYLDIMKDFLQLNTLHSTEFISTVINQPNIKAAKPEQISSPNKSTVGSNDISSLMSPMTSLRIPTKLN